jgi:hypothetical protein
MRRVCKDDPHCFSRPAVLPLPLLLPLAPQHAAAKSLVPVVTLTPPLQTATEEPTETTRRETMRRAEGAGLATASTRHVLGSPCAEWA